MEQYPLEDENLASVKESFEEKRQKAADIPTLSLPELRIEKTIEKRTESKDNETLNVPKPIPSLDPIPVEKEIIKNQKPIKEEASELDNDLDIKTKETSVQENKRMTRQLIPPPQKYSQNEPDSEDWETEDDKVIEQKRQTFFSTLKENLLNQDSGKIVIDKSQIMQNMKNFQQNIMEKEKVLKEKQKLDSELAEKIMMLELLEEGWYMLRKEIESKQILLLQKEKLIDMQVTELKSLMEKEKKIDKTIPPDKWFVLKDGKKIASINELKETLKTAEDHVFYHHVNSLKNDFSSWIRHVFNDAVLADRIISAKTKEELIQVLEKD